MRITVGPNRCEGHARCVATAPTVFALDEEDYATVLVAPVPTDLEDIATRAVGACPVAALRADPSEGS